MNDGQIEELVRLAETQSAKPLVAYVKRLLAAERAAVVAEDNAALRADAERYRWLRDVGNSTWQPLRDRYTPSAGSEHNAARAGLVDAAIDSARAKEPGDG